VCWLGMAGWVAACCSRQRRHECRCRGVSLLTSLCALYHNCMACEQTAAVCVLWQPYVRLLVAYRTCLESVCCKQLPLLM